MILMIKNYCSLFLKFYIIIFRLKPELKRIETESLKSVFLKPNCIEMYIENLSIKGEWAAIEEKELNGLEEKLKRFQNLKNVLIKYQNIDIAINKMNKFS